METTRSRPTEPPAYPWKIFWFLLFASIAGMAAVLPFVFGLFPKLVSGAATSASLSVVVAVQLMESALLFAAIIALGLRLARKVGIEMPVLRRWFYPIPQPAGSGSLVSPVIVGIAIAAFSLLVFYTIFLSRIPDWPVAAEARLPIWTRFLACIYGAINEELLGRLFFLSLFIWHLKKLARDKSLTAGPISFWIANVIVSILFALGHIPSAKLLMTITPTVIVALLTINGAASLAFGYLCWRRGLEAAILAHFANDIVLHVIGPIFFRG